MNRNTPTNMRDFRLSDLIWIEPIAKKYGEWEIILRNLDFLIAGYVIPEKAFVYLYGDSTDVNFLALAGTTDKSGIHQFLRLLSFIRNMCNETKTPIKMYFQGGDEDWQQRLASWFGLTTKGGDGEYLYTPSII